MRLFYGGRASKDPPLTTILLLVFVLVCHGVSGDETTTTEGGCNSIPETVAVNDIINKCSSTSRIQFRVNLVWMTFSDVSKDKIEKFFEKKSQFAYGMKIEDNKKIDTLSLKNVQYIGDLAKGSLYIVNTNLNTIEFFENTDPAADGLQLSGKIVVRGNKHLKQDVLTMISSAAVDGSVKDIQTFGECFVPSLITELKELDDCHYVVGDLSFANWPIGTTTNEIKWIQGNVKIINTDLTKLPFSQKEKIKIDGNFEFQDNAGLCWINDENYKDYFEVKGKVRIRNTPCPYPPSASINTTTKKTKKSKKTMTTAAPAETEETTTKESSNVLQVIPALSVVYMIL